MEFAATLVQETPNAGRDRPLRCGARALSGSDALGRARWQPRRERSQGPGRHLAGGAKPAARCDYRHGRRVGEAMEHLASQFVDANRWEVLFVEVAADVFFAFAQGVHRQIRKEPRLHLLLALVDTYPPDGASPKR